MESAKELIRPCEGLKLTSYVCPAGFWTIGYGHKSADVVEGMKISKDQAEDLLDHDVHYFSGVVSTYVKVPLNDNQIAALVSFVFNLGDQRLKSSTLLKKINANDFEGAALEFLRWNKATVDGKLVVLDGLTKRRKAESDLFMRT